MAGMRSSTARRTVRGSAESGRFDEALAKLMAEVQAVAQQAVMSGTLDRADADAAVEAFAARLPDADDPTETIGPFFDTPGLCRRLGVTRQALNSRAHRNSLLAVEADEGPNLYPAWQFSPDMTVVPGLPAVLKALHLAATDGFSKAVWLTTPQQRLGGMSAADWIRQGHDLRVVLEAARADAERLAA